jgi:3-methylfumaryl-CoA hydratase
MATLLAQWAPGPTEVTETITPEPAVALAGLFNCDPPATGPGHPIPFLWHWLYFLDRPAQWELGPDGHPAAGRFTPPLPRRRRMYAGGRVSYLALIRCGDRIARRSEMAGWTVRHGRAGELLFVTVRHTFTRGGTVVATEEQDLVYRSSPAPTPSSQPLDHARQTPTPPPSRSTQSQTSTDPVEPFHRWQLQLIADPILLFRFSALTYNAHRIHYDLPYATTVEGHPGLVVHGPLLALLCAELPRRHVPERPVSQVSFRARAPLYTGQLLAVSGGPHGDGCELQVTAPDGTTGMTAEARFAGDTSRLPSQPDTRSK